MAREANLTKAAEELKSEFESDELSEKSLKAFEIKAKQKLVDFSDYLNIYAVKTIDESFKNQANQLIRDLFVSDHTKISNRLLNQADKNVISLNDLLGKTFDYQTLNLKFDSIKITESLHRTKEMKYTGSLEFYRLMNAITATDTLVAEPLKMEAEIIVSKAKKAFGNDTLVIWNLSLGSIR